MCLFILKVKNCHKYGSIRGGLTIWKPGHCPRARGTPGTFFIGFFEFGQGHRGPMILYCSG
ncbi:unnamed protein product, partial [Staurois parvus]